MRKGLIILGIIHVICIFGIINGSTIGFAIGSAIAAAVSFWRAKRPQSNTWLEFAAFLCMYLFISGIASGLIIDKKIAALYYVFAVMAIILFVLCERIINCKIIFPKTDAIESETQYSNLQQSKTSSFETDKNHPLKLISKEYDFETPYMRLIRICNPANYVDNYDKDKVNIANELYANVLATNRNDKNEIDKLCEETEKRLNINLLDETQYNNLKQRLNPKNFTEPYDQEKVSLANELYSQLMLHEINWTIYSKVKEQAKSLIDDKNTKEESIPTINMFIWLLWISVIVFLLLLFTGKFESIFHPLE